MLGSADQKIAAGARRGVQLREESQIDRGLRIVREGNGDGRRVRGAVNLVRDDIDPDIRTIQCRGFGFQVVKVGVAPCGQLYREYVTVVACGFQRLGNLTGGNSFRFSKRTVDENPDNRVDVGGAVVDPDLHDTRRQGEVSVVGVGTRRLKFDDRFKRGRLTVNREQMELGI